MSKEKEETENPQAFPMYYEFANEDFISDKGMTLRDYFAAKAMQHHPLNLHQKELISQWSYAMADAMLKERSK